MNDEPGLAVPTGVATILAVVFLVRDGRIQRAPADFSRYSESRLDVFLEASCAVFPAADRGQTASGPPYVSGRSASAVSALPAQILVEPVEALTNRGWTRKGAVPILVNDMLLVVGRRSEATEEWQLRGLQRKHTAVPPAQHQHRNGHASCEVERINFRESAATLKPSGGQDRHLRPASRPPAAARPQPLPDSRRNRPPSWRRTLFVSRDSRAIDSGLSTTRSRDREKTPVACRPAAGRPAAHRCPCRSGTIRARPLFITKSNVFSSSDRSSSSSNTANPPGNIHDRLQPGVDAPRQK